MIYRKMFFLGIFCLVSICVATPIISNREGKVLSDGQSENLHIILEPFNLSDGFPWITAHSEKSRVFVIKGVGSKKFGILNVFNQELQPRSEEKIDDKAELYKLVGDNKDIGAKSNFDWPCKRYHLNEKTSAKVITPTQIDKDQNSKISNWKTSLEETSPAVKIHIPVSSSNDVTTTTFQNKKPTIVNVPDYNHQPEFNIQLKNSLVNGEVKSDSISDNSATADIDSSNKHRISGNFYEKIKSQLAKNEKTLENITEKPILSEKEIEPVVKLNIHAPPSIDSTITLSTESSSLSAIQKNKSVAEKKEIKPENDFKEDDDLQTQSSIDVPSHDAMDQVTENTKQQAFVVFDENYPKTNKIETIPEEPEAYEEAVKPRIQLHIPPPPSLDGTIVLPSGYPTLAALRNEGKMLIFKINREKLQNQEQPNKNVEVVVTGKQFNGNAENLEPTVKFNVHVPPSKQLRYKNSKPETDESNSFETITERSVLSEEETKPIALKYKEKNIMQNVSKQEKLKRYEDKPCYDCHSEMNKVEVVNKKSLGGVQEEPEIDLKKVISVKNDDLSAHPHIHVPFAHDTIRRGYVTENTEQKPFAASEERDEVHRHHNFEQPLIVSQEISEDNFPKTNKIETVPEEREAYEEDVKPRIQLHIPPPPSLDGTIVLPSENPTLAVLRNEENMLQMNVNKIKHQSQDDPEKHAQVAVMNKQSNGNVEKMDPTVKFNVPLSLQSIIPSEYLTVSNLNDIKQLIQKLMEQKRKQSTKVSDQKLDEPISVEQVKPAIKMNIPAPPSIDHGGSSSGYQTQYLEKYNTKIFRNLPAVNVHKPNIMWNTPAPLTVHRSVKFSSGYPSLSALHNKMANKQD